MKDIEPKYTPNGCDHIFLVECIGNVTKYTCVICGETYYTLLAESGTYTSS